MLQELGNLLSDYWPSLLLTAAVAYLLGSLNFAIIVTRLMTKSDIRKYGSGNAGATNVLRSQGKVPAVLTTLGDLAKSIVAVIAGRYIVLGIAGMPNELLSSAAPYEQEFYGLAGAYLAGLFCIVGHLYPLYFGFRGGKGVLTTLGMMLILDWRVALLSLALFIIVVIISRMVSLGSICAAILLPILTWLFRAFVDHKEGIVVLFCTLMTTVIAVILVAKHAANIKRIAAGTESRISFSSKEKEKGR